jgi:hypothetical protein
VKKGWKSHFLLVRVSAPRNPVCRRFSVASFSVIFFFPPASSFVPWAVINPSPSEVSFTNPNEIYSTLLSCVQSNYEFHNAFKGSGGSVCLPNIDLHVIIFDERPCRKSRASVLWLFVIRSYYSGFILVNNNLADLFVPTFAADAPRAGSFLHRFSIGIFPAKAIAIKFYLLIATPTDDRSLL